MTDTIVTEVVQVTPTFIVKEEVSIALKSGVADLAKGELSSLHYTLRPERLVIEYAMDRKGAWKADLWRLLGYNVKRSGELGAGAGTVKYWFHPGTPQWISDTAQKYMPTTRIDAGK